MIENKRTSRRAGWIVLGIVGVAVWGLWGQSSAALGPKGKGKKTKVNVLFSPNGGCSKRLVREIENAKRTIRVQAFFFTSEPIADALIEAKKRGVEVEMIIDKSQEKQRFSRWRVLRRAGIPIYFDREHATANNKIMLIDHHTVTTGSMNFTKAAEEKNAENLLIIKHHDKVFEKYLANYERHLDHSKRYSG